MNEILVRGSKRDHGIIINHGGRKNFSCEERRGRNVSGRMKVGKIAMDLFDVFLLLTVEGTWH